MAQGFLPFAWRIHPAHRDVRLRDAGFIQNMLPDQLAEWFVPHEHYGPTVPPREIAVLRTEDAVEWMKRNFPFVPIPWLRFGDHIEIIDEREGEFGDLIAYGDAGYLYVFVADLL